MSTRRKLLIIALVVVLIPVVIVLVNVGNQFRMSVVAADRIKSDRQTAEKSADERLAAAVEVLQRAGITTAQLGASKIDACYVTHNDQGWVVADWYQDCYLRYVIGFTTNVSKDEALRKLSADPSAATHYGEANTSPKGQEIFKCRLFEKDYKATVLYRPTTADPKDSGCDVPDPLQGIGSVHGPIVLDEELSVKTYQTFDPGTVGQSQDQIWIMFDAPYYHEDLGCGVGIIFCTNPRSTPVHPSF